jgi:nitrite reductase (NADH) small subunit
MNHISRIKTWPRCAKIVEGGNVAEFVTVADLAELKPGDCKTVEAEGRAIAIFNVSGSVYALENVCLHQGGPLGDGDLDGEVVTCPWHGWQYNVCTGELCGDSATRIATYPVKIEGSAIMVAP